jgi:hypothetical protein
MAVNLNLTKNWKHNNSFVLSKTSKDELHGSTQNHARRKMTSLMELDWGEYNILELSLHPNPLVMGISHYMFFPTQKVQSLIWRSLSHS